MMQVVIYTSLNVIYDEKGQCVSKGLPGCDPIIYRYDKGNIPVLPYCRPQSVSYYDDYLFMDDLVTSETKRVLSCDTLSNYGIPVVGTDKSKGFLTGTAVYSLTAPASKTVSSFYYDYQGRMIQSHRKEAVGGYGHIHRSLTFTGKPSRTRETVELPDGQVDSLVTVRAYDGQDRLVSETTSLNDKSQSVSYGYDEIGRLTSRVYGTAANPSALTETLAYNIRDQLTDQNSNVFNMSLRYQEPTLGAVPKYNGSVSEWEWNHGVGTETNAWSLSYDGVGRLTDAQRFVGGVQTNSFSERSITYDRNSNALTLTRYGENAATPDEILAYSYNGNLLRNISNSGASGGGGQYTHDANGNLTRDGLSTLDIDYNDRNLTSRISSGGATLAEYEYLADGTKLRALDGGGNGYQYRGSLIYTQTAGQTGSPAITLDCAVTSAGRIVRENTADGSSTYKVQHYLRDHLGSVRAVIDGDTGTVIEASDYYPFGKGIQVTAPVSEPVGGSLYAAEPVVAPVAPATSVVSTSSPNRWHFSGKESQSILNASIPLLDFGARMYNPAIARWTAADPLSEKYHGISPYAYCLGNPIVNIDVKGDSVRVYIETVGLGHTWISAGEGDEMVVYTYGRYDHTYKGNALSDGPGVLVRLSGDKAREFNDYKQSEGNMSIFTLTDVKDNDIMNIANELFDSSGQLPSERSKRYANDTDAHIIDEYSLLNNNCTTFVSDLIKMSGSKVLNYQRVIYASPIGSPITIPSTHRFVNPRSMKSYLSNKLRK